MMRVLHVIPSVAPVRGGPSQAIVEMVKALTVKGDEVSVVTTNDNGPTLLDVPTNDWVEYQGISVRFFPRFSPSYSSVREFAFSAKMTQWLWQHINDYDILHVHAIFSYPSTAAMTIARLKKVPYVVRPLGQLCQWSLKQGAQKKQAYLRLIERANLNGSSALHLTSSQEQREISELGLSVPSNIIPHGLQMHERVLNARQKLRSHFDLPMDEPVVLFLSRLHPKKGIDYLIEGLSKISDQRFTLILAGNGEPEYEEIIRDKWLVQHGVSQRTILPGFVGGELKQILLQGADIFALTSYSENFGVAVLEALEAGLPALVTPGVALSELVDEHGFGEITELDVTDISEHLKTLLKDSKRLADMGESARKFVQSHYTWERVSDALTTMYANAISEKAA